MLLFTYIINIYNLTINSYHETDQVSSCFDGPNICSCLYIYIYIYIYISHFGVLWVYMYMIFVHGYRPLPKHFVRSAILLFVVAVGIALPLSFIFEHNFMFMYDAGGTPLEIIQPLGHAIYIIGTVLVMFIIMALYYSPIYYFVIRKERLDN